MKNYKIFSLFWLFLLPLFAGAQSIVKIETTEGVQTFYVWDVKSITFEEDPEVLSSNKDEHQPIDFQLYKETLWSSANLTLHTGEQGYSLFGWGDPTGKNHSENLDYFPSTSPAPNIAGSSFDLISLQLGTPWRMPSKKEWEELLSSSTIEKDPYNEASVLITSNVNGEMITLPLLGQRDQEEVTDEYVVGYYWTSTLADDDKECAVAVRFTLDASDQVTADFVNMKRYLGLSLRPVQGGIPEVEVAITLGDVIVNHVGAKTVEVNIQMVGDLASITEWGVYLGPEGDFTNVEPIVGQLSSIDETGAVKYTLVPSQFEYGRMYYVKAYVNYGKDKVKESQPFCFTAPTKYPVEYVDLGLRSGLLWATYNLGAEQVYENGKYLAWADPEEKTTRQSDYPRLVEAYPIDIAGTEYDVVTHILGDGWHMPNEWDFLELKDNCKWSVLHINGVWGIQGEGPNGNKIFLPMAGNRQGDGSYYQAGSDTQHGYGYYWTSEGVAGLDANYFTFPNINKSQMRIAATRKWLGMFIRPVKGTSNTEETYQGGGQEEPTSEYDGAAVDLGLSVDWAAYNIGATKETELGSAFAWGETEPRTSFTSKNYQLYVDGEYGNYVVMDSPIAGSDYDAAHCIWGGKWVMPTEIHFLELFELCTWKWETKNGVQGYRVTSKENGKSIFLPANDGLGQYWSSTLYTHNDGFKNKYAYLIRFQQNVVPTYCVADNRYQGMQIRPVRLKK